MNSEDLVIDGTCVAGGVGGVSRYFNEVLAGLTRQSKKVILVVWDKSDVPTLVGIHIIRLKSPKFLSKFLISRLFFLWFCFTRKPKSIWLPSQRALFWVSKKTKLVMTVHDTVCLNNFSSMKPLGGILDFISLVFVIYRKPQVIVPSLAVKEQLSAFFAKFNLSTEIVCIPHGVDHYPLKIDASTILSNAYKNWFLSAENKIKVVVLGSFEPRKNLLNLFAGVEIAQKKIEKRISLVFIGCDGWSGIENALRTMASTSNLDVNFFKCESDEIIGEIVRKCDVGMVISFDEGFGFSAYEMALSELSLVLSDIAVFREGFDGFAEFVDPKDEYSIAEGVAQATNFSRPTKRLVKPKRQNLMQLTWEKSSRKHMEIFG